MPGAREQGVDFAWPVHFAGRARPGLWAPESCAALPGGRFAIPDFALAGSLAQDQGGWQVKIVRNIAHKVSPSSSGAPVFGQLEAGPVPTGEPARVGGGFFWAAAIAVLQKREIKAPARRMLAHRRAAMPGRISVKVGSRQKGARGAN